MKISMAQIEIAVSLERNTRKIIDIVTENPSTDLFLFPELSLSSYDLSYIRSLSSERVQNALRHIRNRLRPEQCAVVGGPDFRAERIYNSLFIVSRDRILVYDKRNLTDEESSLFSPGKDRLIFRHGGRRIGLFICRDQNDLDLVGEYRGAVDLILHASAHYYPPELAVRKLEKNYALPITRAIDCGTIWCKVNCVGRLDSRISLGRSLIADPEGAVLRQATTSSEELIQITV